MMTLTDEELAILRYRCANPAAADVLFVDRVKLSAALGELSDLRTYFHHIAGMTSPLSTIPYGDPRVPVEAWAGDFMMMDGDLHMIMRAPARTEHTHTVEELATAAPTLHGLP